MELYYKDLISNETSLEKLVDDLMLVVQGAGEVAEASGAHLSDSAREELRTRLERLQDGCHRLRQHAIHRALATDEALRQHPYSFAGLAFGLGLLAGVLLNRQKRKG